MFGFRRDASRDLSPDAVIQALKAGQALLVDVREPAEFAVERIHGAVLAPLSTFDPKSLPDAGDRRVIFQCGSGKRSMTALNAYLAAGGADTAAHLAGGIGAWKQAGLPVVRIDPATGQVRDPGHF